MTFSEIQRDYCRKVFIFYVYKFKNDRHNREEYLKLLHFNLERHLLKPFICVNVNITFDESIWPPEDLTIMEHRAYQLDSLVDNIKYESNILNIIRLSYQLYNSSDYHVFDIDLRNKYEEIINSDVFCD